jgi:drug/metabolite transporter (DMT)-like permease
MAAGGHFKKGTSVKLNILLYLAAMFIWGSTWLGIKLQLSQVPPVLSVGYRFCLASSLLFLYCLLTKKKLAFSLHDHKFMALQGATLFSFGYCMSYLSTVYLTSGLVAVVFSTLMMWNILNLKLFMSQPVDWRAFSGGVVGLAGICILFWQDLTAFSATRGLIGLALALLGSYLASIGNIVGSRNAKSGIPVTQANAYGMAYGGVLTLCIHFGIGGTLVMDWSVGYLGPMLYLTIFGSVVAFECYMLLIGRIGAEYAAYVMLLVPVLALVLSTLFEQYHWNISSVSGILLVLIGNLVILTRPKTARRVLRRIAF